MNFDPKFKRKKDTLQIRYSKNGELAKALINLKEASSQEYVGIRMADMFIGLISKVMQSLKKALTNDYMNERFEKTLLEPGWFILDDRQLGLYKKLYQTICVDNK